MTCLILTLLLAFTQDEVIQSNAAKDEMKENMEKITLQMSKLKRECIELDKKATLAEQVKQKVREFRAFITCATVISRLKVLTPFKIVTQ